ncbi:MAG: sulfur carrier protein ThiS [Deltaproteobacteria bacterium]|jgi:sulfur carrier protein|nr:sulfur carrier protein ThiS [Deltaproteobacteria bacterium]
MTLTVTGVLKEYPEGINLSRLIELEKVATPMYVTVALNDDFVESGGFGSTALKDGDKVEFLYFMGGGR